LQTVGSESIGTSKKLAHCHSKRQPVFLSVMLYIVILTFKSVDETLQMKAIEQYFHVVLFIILYKVFLRSNLKCLTIQIKAI